MMHLIAPLKPSAALRHVLLVLSVCCLCAVRTGRRIFASSRGGGAGLVRAGAVPGGRARGPAPRAGARAAEATRCVVTRAAVLARRRRAFVDVVLTTANISAYHKNNHCLNSFSIFVSYVNHMSSIGVTISYYDSQVPVEAYGTDARVGSDAVLAGGAILTLMSFALIHIDLQHKIHIINEFRIVYVVRVTADCGCSIVNIVKLCEKCLKVPSKV